MKTELKARKAEVENGIKKQKLETRSRSWWRHIECGRWRIRHWRDLQAHGRAWVRRHLHGVLLARKLIDHVVGHRAVFVNGLLGAVLYRANFWVGRAFDLLAQDGATK